MGPRRCRGAAELASERCPWSLGFATGEGGRMGEYPTCCWRGGGLGYGEVGMSVGWIDEVQHSFQRIVAGGRVRRRWEAENRVW